MKTARTLVPLLATLLLVDFATASPRHWLRDCAAPHCSGHPWRQQAKPSTAPSAPPVASAGAGAEQPWTEWDRLTGNWGGLRTRLEESGIALDLSYVADWSGPLSGGLRERDSYRNLLDLTLAFDLSQLMGWAGATFFIDAYTQHGRDGSADVGDFQAFSNIDSPNRSQIAELWLEQVAFGDRLRLKLGKVDVNSEFAFVDAAGDFLNSSAGFSPSIPLPTYPDPSTGVTLFFYPTASFYVGAGIYDGAGADGVPTGRRGPKTFFSGSKSDAYFTIAEVGLMWESAPIGGRGRLAAGPWVHTGSVDRFGAGRESETAGWFALLEHWIYEESPGDAADEQGIAAFMQYGYADPDVSEVHHHFGIGAAWTGAIPTRDADSFGLLVSWVDLSDHPAAGLAKNETTLEFFYRWQLAPFFSLWGDLQYVVNPGGTADRGDALVGTLRTEISF